MKQTEEELRIAIRNKAREVSIEPSEFIAGANSKEAKVYWQLDMVTKEAMHQFAQQAVEQRDKEIKEWFKRNTNRVFDRISFKIYEDDLQQFLKTKQS